MNDVVLVQKSYSFENLGDDNPHELWRGEKMLFTLEEIAKRDRWRRPSSHQLDQLLKVSLTLLDCEVNEV